MPWSRAAWEMRGRAVPMAEASTDFIYRKAGEARDQRLNRLLSQRTSLQGSTGDAGSRELRAPKERYVEGPGCLSIVPFPQAMRHGGSLVFSRVRQKLGIRCAGDPSGSMKSRDRTADNRAEQEAGPKTPSRLEAALPVLAKSPHAALGECQGPLPILRNWAEPSVL